MLKIHAWCQKIYAENVEYIIECSSNKVQAFKCKTDCACSTE